MIFFVLSLASLAAWIYLACFHGRFWLSGPELPPAASFPHSATEKIAVVVPARDEAASIERCLRSLLAQKYAGSITILLVDDNSTDGTGKIAARVANEPEARERLVVLRGQPLVAGWSGKLWAVHQGLSHTAAQNADFVLLTDADIEHAPDHVASLVAQAGCEHLDLVSEMVRLDCSTWPERALIPAFVFFFQMLYPFRWAADPRKHLAAAAGGTILVSRAALERIGGVECIRGELIDDCSLAREVKRTGGRIWLGHASRTASLRVYAHANEIWNMIARTAYVQLRHSPLLLLGCVLGISLLYLIPPALAMSALGLARYAALSAWLLMAALFQPTLRRYRRAPLWGFALPAIALFYLGATIASALRHYAGHGGGWKARTYPANR